MQLAKTSRFGSIRWQKCLQLSQLGFVFKARSTKTWVCDWWTQANANSPHHASEDRYWSTQTTTHNRDNTRTLKWSHPGKACQDSSEMKHCVLCPVELSSNSDNDFFPPVDTVSDMSCFYLLVTPKKILTHLIYQWWLSGDCGWYSTIVDFCDFEICIFNSNLLDFFYSNGLLLFLSLPYRFSKLM